jgi:excinuclease ABC subunit C
VLPALVEEKLEGLPASPGVYLFKDRQDRIVYVGKAKSLRSRVRSYFQESTSDTRYFIPLLHKIVGDLDTVVTSNEKEAAILENLLIKQHRPRFNVKLRDDKEYPSLKLDPRVEWPRLTVVRTPGNEGAKYFGPYHSATAARRTLHLVNKHFQLRTCTDSELKSRKRPCLQHQIKRCPAPCVYEVDPAFYSEQVRAVALFLEGRHDELSKELESRMHSAASEMRFELAGVYRDQLHAIQKVREEQRVVTVEKGSRDVLALYREGDLCEVALLKVRDGKLTDVATFGIKGAEIPDEEVVSAFLSQHYGRSAESGALSSVPDEILVSSLPDGAAGVEEWLGERAGKSVKILKPQRGPKVALLALAEENARHSFAEKRRASDDVLGRLAQIQERLRLPLLPRRIECCDISHLGGGDTVGAIVAMRDGEPDKARYRSYHVRTVGTASQGVGALGDDYGAMYEVLARRFRRGLKARAPSTDATSEDAENAQPIGAAEDVTFAFGLAKSKPRTSREDPPKRPLSDANGDEAAAATSAREGTEEGANEGDNADQGAPDGAKEGSKEGDWDLPDLFVVDGGKGQLAVALTAARDLGLHDLPIVALAKEKESPLGEALVDRVYLPGQKNAIPLRSHSSSLFFLARLRDEAHRFSNRGREKLGTSRRMRSTLDEVRGVGKVTKTTLLRVLGSLSAVKSATDEALLAVPGVNRRHVAALRAHFGAPEVAEPGPVVPTEVNKEPT